MANREAKKRAKEAARIAHELAQLKAQIEASFVKKAVLGDGILFNEIVDIDGFGQKDKPVVTAIGGFLGQLTLVLHTIARHYKKLD